MLKPLGKEELPEIGLNEDEKIIQENVQRNIRRTLPQVQCWQPQPDVTLLIAGGGPSLELELDDLRAKYADGAKVVSINNTHDWLIERGINPSLHIMLDARDFNSRFVQKPISSCKYLIASQCHPSVFDALEGHDVYLWHPCSTDADVAVLDAYYLGQYYRVVGGGTVMTRAFTLLQMLGFSKFEVYGFDSCFMNDKHHSYNQPENDGGEVLNVEVAGRMFKCAHWMYVQAQDFLGTTKALGQNVDMIVHGDGLISHLIKTGAQELQQRGN